MAKIRVQLQGDKALLAKLEQAGVKASQVLEAAVTAAAKVIEDAAEPAAPGPNIDHETKRKTQKQCIVHVGPDRSHWYYVFAEFGAKPHPISGPLAFEGEGGPVVVASVEHPGRSQAPFLRPAADSQGGRAQDEMGKVLKTAIEGV